MDNNPKRTAAINLLVAREIWPVNYVPMGLRLLWRIGIDIPPPYFISFYGNVFLVGTPMALLYGFTFWFFIWSRQSSSITMWLLAVALGLSFGLTQAAKYKRLKGKYSLPSWDELGTDTK
jgi:Family of unknown function (DUF6404)